MAKYKQIGDFALKSDRDLKKEQEETTHIYHKGARCETDSIGYETPKNRSPLELVLDASNGIIPLWDEDVTLRWRFQEQSLLPFQNPEAVKDYVREIMGEALIAWGTSVPVRFVEAVDPWDFEIVISSENSCNLAGCTLARAFFPDAGQHDLVLFPRMFEQVREEQIETMAHELGHIFGLRHFFAKVSETAFPSEIFGNHNKFSIMNYGEDSTLTEEDKSDLALLYSKVWSGELTEINGTPIELFQPFSHFRTPIGMAQIFERKNAAMVEKVRKKA